MPNEDGVKALEAAGAEEAKARAELASFDAETARVEASLAAGQGAYGEAERGGDLPAMERALDGTILPAERELERRARLRSGLVNILEAKTHATKKASVFRAEMLAATQKATAVEIAERFTQAARILVSIASELEAKEGEFQTVSRRAKSAAERLGLAMPMTGKQTVPWVAEVRPWRQELELWIQRMEGAGHG